MNDLISRKALLKKLSKHEPWIYFAEHWLSVDAVYKEIKAQPTVKTVPLSEIYRVIAGHSDYHGDNILAALTCIAEGKEVKPVKPLSQPTTDGWIPQKGESNE